MKKIPLEIQKQFLILLNKKCRTEKRPPLGETSSSTGFRLEQIV